MSLFKSVGCLKDVTQSEYCSRNSVLCVGAMASMMAGTVCWYYTFNRKQLLIRKRQKEQERVREVMEEIQTRLQEDQDLQEIKNEITNLPVKDLWLKLQSGHMDPVDVIKAYMFKGLDVNGRFNCILEPLQEFEDWAKEATKKGAVKQKGILYGLPVSLKGNISVQGYDTHQGLSNLLERPMEEDAVVVKVLKLQGAVPFVRSNLPQLAASYETCNPIAGRTLNPYDTDRTPGGSSGGEGALLASGGSVLGMATDLGGSIRVPAHFCGVCGLRPTSKRISTKNPSSDVRYSGMNIVRSTIGPMAQEVDGVVLLMKGLLCNYMFDLDKTVVPIPFRNELYGSKQKLRIGFYLDNGIFTPLPACQRAVKNVASILKKLGHEVVETHVDGDKLLSAITNIYCPARSGDRLATARSHLQFDKVDSTIADMYAKVSNPTWLVKLKSIIYSFINPYASKFWLAYTGKSTVNEWWELESEYQRYREEHINQWHKEGLDVVICPVAGLVAGQHGTSPYLDHPAFTYTRMYNLVDFPSGVIPVSEVSEDDIKRLEDYPEHKEYQDARKVMEGSFALPIGVQVVSLPWQEEIVLRVMKEIELSLKGT